MRYREILDQLNNSGSQSSGDDYEDMAKVIVNFIYKELLIESEKLEEKKDYTLTTVVSQQTYGLPIQVKEVTSLLDEANNNTINLISGEEFDRRFVGLTESGLPLDATPYGKFGVHTIPSTAGTLTVQSSSTADLLLSGDYEVFIHGLTSGLPTRETIVLNGTTPVASANSYDAQIDGVKRIVLSTNNSQTFTGTVTVKDNAGNIIAQVPPFWEESPEYYWIKLYPTPDAVRSILLRTTERKQPLIHDDDWPEIDSDYHDLLVLGAEEILLPHAGKSIAGKKSGKKYDERKDFFLGAKQSKQSRGRGFRSVTNMYIGGDGDHENTYFRRLNIVNS